VLWKFLMFKIDTGARESGGGVGRFDYCQIMLDGIADECEPGASQDVLDAALAKAIVRDLNKPKRDDTVRGHFIRYWPIIAAMSERSPASFDFVMQEFAERLAEFS